jgi:hypothetical protein
LQPWRPYDGRREGRRIRELILSPAEREQLARVLNSDPKPYRRERAAALLQVAQGAIALHVARRGLLRPRDPDTV